MLSTLGAGGGVWHRQYSSWDASVHLQDGAKGMLWLCQHTRPCPHTPNHAQTLGSNPCISPNTPVLQPSWPLPRWALCQECPSPIHQTDSSPRSLPSTPHPPTHTRKPSTLSLQALGAPGNSTCIRGAIVICLPPLGHEVWKGG